VAGVTLTSAGTQTETAAQPTSRYNGAVSNLRVRLRVSAVENLSHLDLELTNDGGATVMSNDLRNAYTPRNDREWMTVSLGRGQDLNGKLGHWQQHGPGTFDWSAVNGVRLVVEGKSGQTVPVTVDVNDISAVPAQRTGGVAIVFDDGYQSILPAAAYLHKLGLPASVAVIGKYTRLPSQEHLNVEDLHALQNAWGWNMVNHTDQHLDGVNAYSHTRDLAGYQHDIVTGAQFLQQAGLNSAPNWFIYPHGDTDDALKSVVGRLYPFARVTQNEPEAYPFGDPLAVKTLEIQSPQDAEAGADGGYTSPAQVAQAIADTRRFGNTLIITMHRIHATPSDPPGYALRDFQAIADELKASGLPVRTLSQLDAANGVPEDNRIHVIPARPSRLLPTITVHDAGQHRTVWSRLTGWL
jgi:peptidoglycan/xylan/chitin deacetylase (PgdA/CDA1 family)